MRTTDGQPDPADDRSTAASAGRARVAALPWSKRPRRLRRQLAAALVVVALLAVATFGALNFVAARDLLLKGTEQQLADFGATRATSIAAGTDRLVSEISAASSDLGLSQALADLTTAFAALGAEELTPEQRTELDDWYTERVVDPLNEAGLGPFDSDDLVPTTPAGRWLQYHYTVRPPGEPPPLNAGDGTEYSEVNAAVTDAAREFSESKGAGDVLLIDGTGTIVYSLEKRNDVGTSLVTGPYSDSALATVVTDSLPQARAGTTLITDFAISATGRPALYAVSAVTSGTRVIGAVAVEVPVAALTALATATAELDTVDLGPADAYIVASDQALQSEPLAWADDPESYLDRLASDEATQAEAELIKAFGTPVGIQTVDTAPVRAALDGDDFRGRATNALGESTFATSLAFTAGGRTFVVVTEVPRSAVLQPLSDYLVQVLVVLALTLPIVAGLGIWLSGVFTRPIRPTVEAAEAIVAGDRAPDLDTSRGDEFGDLARRLSAMAGALVEREADLAAEYEQTRQLLLAVLPPQLIDADGKIAGTGETAGQTTVVAVTVSPSDERQDQELAGEALRRAASVAETVAGETGLYRVRTSADRHLFVAAPGSANAGADAALQFVSAFRHRIDTEDIDVPLDLHLGLSTGVVATGLLDTGSLTFGAWGDPVRRALALASLAQTDPVLVDTTTAQVSTPGRWPLERAHDIVDLDGEPMELFTLEPDEAAVPSSP